MSRQLPFLDRAPTTGEANWIQAAVSSFSDGTGDPTSFGDTIPNWRDYERLFAEFFGGVAPEDKQVFDVFVPVEDGEWVGISVKSKCLGPASKIETLDANRRIYIELSNSPQKLWNGVAAFGVNPNHWAKPSHASDLGEALLCTVENWHKEAHTKFAPPKHCEECLKIDLDRSIFLNVSYSKPRNGVRLFQVHSFDLQLERPSGWTYRAPKNSQVKSIMGTAKTGSGNIWDWYPNAGGQLKYYPLASSARFQTSIFPLLKAGKALPIEKKMEQYWPDLAPNWSKAV